MADYEFEQATTWTALQTAHDTWVNAYNHQAHWAHRTRDDGRETPADVLDWTYGTVWDESALHYAFYATRFGRKLDKAGYVRFRHYRLYAEPGLERRRVAVWLYKEQLSIAFNDSLLVQYSVDYQPDHTHFRTVTEQAINGRDEGIKFAGALEVVADGRAPALEGTADRCGMHTQLRGDVRLVDTTLRKCFNHPEVLLTKHRVPPFVTVGDHPMRWMGDFLDRCS